MRLVRSVSVSVFLLLSMTVGPALAQDIASSDCADCHTENDEDIAVVTEDLLVASVHDGFDCIDCHDTIDDLPHAEALPPVHCGECHEDETAAYVKHGRSLVGQDKDIPGCADCHGSHGILNSEDLNSATHRLNLTETCGRCHSDVDLAKKHDIQLQHPVETYKASVHGMAAGIVDFSAMCSDCHATDGSSHQIYGPGDPESAVNHFRIPNTCGKCHKIIEQEYWAGVHGQLAARGETATPVCTSCHGEHGMLAPSDPEARVSSARVAESTCARCHESPVLTEKYGFPEGRLGTFVDSYHGLKSQAGDGQVANCSSCHGSHFILPSRDDRSSTHPSRLMATCGSCHPKISPAMAATRIHKPETGGHSGWALIFANLYMVLIVGVIGVMLFYVITDFARNARQADAGPQVRRMTPNEVAQHTFLAVSFLLLVLTGFALRFSEARMFEMLFGWTGGFTARGNVHRLAGVIFALASLWHLVYLMTRRGRQFLGDMAMNRQDAVEFGKMVAFNLGRRADRPRFGRFSYVEKGEYWALIWGTVIMLLTGLLLWFDNVAVRFIPKSALDVILVIHFYEAVLATLAIAVWHLYATVFNPEVYPGNPAWRHGKMPVAMYEHEHPAEAEKNPPTIEP